MHSISPLLFIHSLILIINMKHYFSKRVISIDKFLSLSRITIFLLNHTISFLFIIADYYVILNIPHLIFIQIYLPFPASCILIFDYFAIIFITQYLDLSFIVLTQEAYLVCIEAHLAISIILFDIAM